MSQEEKSKGGSRFGRLAPLASLLPLMLAACSSLLGIEELHEGPAPGGGTGAESGADSAGLGGASGASKGGNSNANAGTVGDMGGEPNIGVAGDGTTQGGSGGRGGSAGGSAGKAGGSGGSVGGTPVTGHLIDYWGHKLPGVPVEIDGTKVTSDAQGAFTVPNVAAEYEASVLVKDADNSALVANWVFQGLTRRDPTLQVEVDIVSHHQDVEIDGSGLSTTLTGTRTFSVAAAGPDGQDEFQDVVPDGFTEGSSLWFGPATTTETAYGLIWEPDAKDLPTSYVAFDSKTLALVSGSSSKASLNFDLTADTINASPIAGTVTPAGSDTRENWAYVRFSGNAAITLVRDQTGSNTFSYLMPSLTDGTIVFAASEGDSTSGGFGLVHKDGLAAGASGIAAKIPAPASNLAIAPAGKVSGTTVFSFQTAGGNTGPFLIQFVNQDQNSLERLFIVTAKTSFTLPKVVTNGNALLRGNSYYWRIQTHGVFGSVDAMAVPTGYLDEFSGSGYWFGKALPVGPRRGDGAFSMSSSQLITLAP